MRLVWRALDPPTEEARKRAVREPWVMSRSLGMALGLLSECWSAIIGKDILLCSHGTGYRIPARSGTIILRRHDVCWDMSLRLGYKRA